jgi:hypothetical protein
MREDNPQITPIVADFFRPRREQMRAAIVNCCYERVCENGYENDYDYDYEHEHECRYQPWILKGQKLILPAKDRR